MLRELEVWPPSSSSMPTRWRMRRVTSIERYTRRGGSAYLLYTASSISSKISKSSSTCALVSTCPSSG